MKTMRKSNFELLRIISMLMIVAGHYKAQSGTSDVAVIGINNTFSAFMGSGSRVAVGLFLLIGVWFMVDAKFSAKRILKLYSALWFYCVGIAAIVKIGGGGTALTIKDYINAVLPLWRASCWFVPAYIQLLLLSPFLKKVIEWNKNSLKIFLLVLFYATCFKATTSFSLMDHWLDISLWFIFIYLMMGYYKKYLDQKIRLNKYVSIIVGLGIYACLVFGAQMGTIFSDGGMFTSISNLCRLYLSDYKSFPNFVCAFLIFYFFKNIDLGSNKTINSVSGSTLGVYLIHQSPSLIYSVGEETRCRLWTELMNCDTWINQNNYIIAFIGVVLITFIAASIIDKFRIACIEPLWMKSKLFNKICRLLDRTYRLALNTESDNYV